VSEPIKIVLTNQGEDVETPWAVDLGPGPTPGSRRVRLDNVPFLHAKPTYGDVIVVVPDEDGRLTWDAQGVPFDRIGERIAEDGGRYAMIVDWLPGDEGASKAIWKRLVKAVEAHGAVPEGCFGPRDGEPGRMYVAVAEGTEPDEVMAWLASAGADCALTLVHPSDDEDDEG
jgi:hypothetical protein